MNRIRAVSVALAGALGAVFWGRSARAFCRESTMLPGPDYDPQVSGCFGGVDEAGGPPPSLYWRNVNVSFSFEQDIGQGFIALSDAERVASKAFAAWTSAAWCMDTGGPPSIRVFEFPQVSCDSVPTPANPFLQHNNPIIFRQGAWPYDSVNALGYTTLTFDSTTGEIYGATIEINTSGHPIVVDVDGPVPQGSYDLPSILTHEAGHFLGLAHSADMSAVMYAYYHPLSATPTADDLAGICSIYPPNQSRNTMAGSVVASQCDPTPARGFALDCGFDAGDSAVCMNTPDTDASLDGTADADPPHPCTTQWLFACSHGRAPGPKGTAVACSGLFALVWVLRRARVAARRGRSTAAASALALALVGGTLAWAGNADASVSVAVLLDDLVSRASAIAVVTPVEKRSAWEGGRIVTYTRLRVDRLRAGQVGDEVVVRTFGGIVGNIGQAVEGEATFAIGRPSVVFLSSRGPDGPDLVVEGAQGQFPIAEVGGRRVVTKAPNVGAIVAPPHSALASGARLANAALEGRSVEDTLAELSSLWVRAHGPKR